jgi:hypothetical protein
MIFDKLLAPELTPGWRRWGGPSGNAGLRACGSWGSPMVEIDNPPIGEVLLTAVRSTPTPCSRCQVEPRLPRQRWGRACLTAYARHRREWRRAMRSGVTRSKAATTPPVTPLAPMTRSHDSATPPLPICGQGVPPGFSPGCGLPFRPRVAWPALLLP